MGSDGETEAYEGAESGDGVNDKNGGQTLPSSGGDGELAGIGVGILFAREAICVTVSKRASSVTVLESQMRTGRVSNLWPDTLRVFAATKYSIVPTIDRRERDTFNDWSGKGGY